MKDAENSAASFWSTSYEPASTNTSMTGVSDTLTMRVSSPFCHTALTEAVYADLHDEGGVPRIIVGVGYGSGDALAVLGGRRGATDVHRFGTVAEVPYDAVAVYPFRLE